MHRFLFLVSTCIHSALVTSKCTNRSVRFVLLAMQCSEVCFVYLPTRSLHVIDSCMMLLVQRYDAKGEVIGRNVVADHGKSTEPHW